jgi:hypothetical protein
VSEFEHRPLEEHYEEKHQKVEDPTALDMEDLDKDLKGAVDSEGAEVVADALAQMAEGTAHSHELMAWIDDLRDPDRHDPEPVVPDGFLHDFEADTELAASALEVPTDDIPPAAPEIEDTAGGNDDDADYFFSATRKRKLGEGDEEDGDDKPVEGEAKPAAVKAPKTKTTKNP